MTANTEPQVAQLNIGELLAEKRHQRAESFSDVTGQVRLSSEILEKLEKNQFEAIGTAVYVRGYLGIYAKHLDLDVAYIIDQYNRQFPAEEVAIRPSAGQPLGQRQQSKRHSKTLSFLVAGLVTGSLVYGYTRIEPLLLEQGLKQTDSVGTTATAESADNQTQTLTTIIDDVEAANNLADDALNGVPIAGSASLITDIELDLSTPADTETAPTTAVASADKPTLKLELESAKNLDNTTQNSDKSSDAPASTESANTVAKPSDTANRAPAKPIAVTITFNADCWAKVTDANDKVLASRVYKKDGRKLKVKGTAPLSIVLGNPDAVKSVTLNGQSTALADYKVGRITYRMTTKTDTN